MWYAVWVRSGQENRVLELCKTFRHYHPDAYEECFIPTYEKYRKVKGQPTKQLAHLLPGYLFFVSDHPQELQKLLKRIPEFAKTLGDDDGAIPLYQEEVEFLEAGGCNRLRSGRINIVFSTRIIRFRRFLRTRT